MPTSRPRHLITETELVARALDDAARRWPEEGGVRSRLLLRLVQEGHQALVDAEAGRREARVAAIRATSGALTGVYGESYLDDLREDWPA